MATRSRIGIKHRDGSITAVYCHSDGYFDYNGRMLFEHYNSHNIASELINLGDLSSIKEEIGERHDFEWRYEPQFKSGEYSLDWDKIRADPREKMTTAYGRDRQEQGIEPVRYANLTELAEVFEEYLYLFDEARMAWIACSTYVESAEILKWYLLSDIAAVDYKVAEDDEEETEGSGVQVPEIEYDLEIVIA